MVTQAEIYASLVSIKLMVLGNSEPYHKLQKLIVRMKSEGIAQPDGYVLVKRTVLESWKLSLSQGDVSSRWEIESMLATTQKEIKP